MTKGRYRRYRKVRDGWSKKKTDKDWKSRRGDPSRRRRKQGEKAVAVSSDDMEEEIEGVVDNGMRALEKKQKAIQDKARNTSSARSSDKRHGSASDDDSDSDAKRKKSKKHKSDGDSIHSSEEVPPWMRSASNAVASLWGGFLLPALDPHKVKREGSLPYQAYGRMPPTPETQLRQD